MKRITATINGKERTYRTNNSGCYLFIDDNGSNHQISCDSGFHSLRAIKSAISKMIGERGKRIIFSDYEYSEFDA